MGVHLYQPRANKRLPHDKLGNQGHQTPMSSMWLRYRGSTYGHLVFPVHCLYSLATAVGLGLLNAF